MAWLPSAAELLCAMRYVGRMLDASKVPPAFMVVYVACQIGTLPGSLKYYLARVQIRRECDDPFEKPIWDLADLASRTPYGG